MNRLARAVLATLISATCATIVNAAVMGSADGARVSLGDSSVARGDSIFIGGWAGGPDQVGVWTFKLPDLGAQTNPFLTATFSLTVVGTEVNNSYGWQSQDLVGLTSDGAPLYASSTVQGPYGSQAATVLQAGITHYTDHTELGTYTSSSAALLQFLNNAYAGGAGANQYVAVRLQDNGGLMWFKGFYVGNSTSIDYTYTPVPEPGVLALVGISSVGLMIRRRAK